MRENVVVRRIMWGDLDSLGIVFYPRYYEWIDASGHLFFEAVGLHLGSLWRKRGLLFGLAETSCRYSRPGRYHEEIRIVTHLRSLGRKTAVLKHRIYAAKEGVLMVEGLEKRVCLDVSDPRNFHSVEIPEDIYEALRACMDA